LVKEFLLARSGELLTIFKTNWKTRIQQTEA